MNTTIIATETQQNQMSINYNAAKSQSIDPTIAGCVRTDESELHPVTQASEGFVERCKPILPNCETWQDRLRWLLLRDDIRDKKLKQEMRLRDEKLKQERRLRDEKLKQERLRDEKLKQERRKNQQKYRKSFNCKKRFVYQRNVIR